MTSCNEHNDPPVIQRGLRADSLVVGMLVLLVATVVQRLLGLVRGIWFCRVLDEQTLGLWSMAFGFLTLVTPMLLLGLPGSMGRFAESFRRQGRLYRYLRGVFCGTAISIALTVAALWYLPGLTGGWIFGEQVSLNVMLALGMTLIAVVVMNCVSDLLSALRQVRAVSLVQFTFSIAFTFIGGGWLYLGGGLQELVVAYGLAALLGAAPGLWKLYRIRGQISQGDHRSSSSIRRNGALWARVLPFAASIWVMNLLVNAFELTDRYMLLHLYPGGVDAAQAAVGQAHSSRILPTLMLSLATLISGIFMPYLSADWEAGFKRRVAQRCKQSFLGVSAAFTLIASCGILIAPWLFNTLMAGKFQGGLEVLPLTFTLCTWSAISMLAQNYLWCAERGKVIGFVLLVAFSINLGLNALLVPHYGLHGAVIGTAIGNLWLLLSFWVCLWREKFPFDRTLFYATVLPATVLAVRGLG